MNSIEAFNEWCEQLPDSPARVPDKAVFDDFEKSIKKKTEARKLTIDKRSQFGADALSEDALERPIS